MTRKSLTSLLLGATLMAGTALPARAEVEIKVMSGDDQHLYIRTKTEDVTRVNGIVGDKGVGVQTFSGKESETYFTKGNIRIDDQRFVELVGDAGVAPRFMAKIEDKRSGDRFWGWMTLGSIVAFFGGFGVGASLGTSKLAAPLMGIGGVGMLSGFICGSVWILRGSYRGFTWEEANDALVLYNKKLDGK